MNSHRLSDQIKVLDPFSPEGIREACSKILEGHNYRLFFENVTKRKLIATYKELAALVMKDEPDDDKWKENIIARIESEKSYLKNWLIGLTRKTAQNLEISKDDYPGLFIDLIQEIESQSKQMGVRDTALLIWCGAATLTVRGSQKAKIGKALEKGIARSALTIIGLDEDKNDFTLNLMPDEEVDRETDVEIRTKRGSVRMDVGMIGEGNPEVIDDKISRVGNNGIVLFDKLSPNSNAWANAEKRSVKLIQMRNSNPVEELRQHLEPIVSVTLDNVPHNEVTNRVLAMDVSRFKFTKML